MNSSACMTKSSSRSDYAIFTSANENLRHLLFKMSEQYVGWKRFCSRTIFPWISERDETKGQQPFRSISPFVVPGRWRGGGCASLVWSETENQKVKVTIQNICVRFQNMCSENMSVGCNDIICFWFWMGVRKSKMGHKNCFVDGIL